MLAFESTAKILFFLHFAAGVCVAGVLIHLTVRVVGYWRGCVIKVPLEKLYTRILVISYAVCYSLGALIYPTFRIRVRHEYFDESLRWATALFEVKEHLASVGMVIVVGIWLLARQMPQPKESADRRLLPLYTGLVAILCAITCFTVWSGWYLTTLKAI